MHLWTHLPDFRCILVGIFNVDIFLYARCLRSHYHQQKSSQSLQRNLEGDSSHPKVDTCICSVKHHWLFWLRNYIHLPKHRLWKLFEMPWDTLPVSATVCRKELIFLSSFLYLLGPWAWCSYPKSLVTTVFSHLPYLWTPALTVEVSKYGIEYQPLGQIHPSDSQVKAPSWICCVT